MEKAILIRRLSDLSDAAKEYDRIYFGTEFCQWLLPTFSDLKQVSGFCKGIGKKLALVTPWVTDTGLDIALNLVSKYLGDEESLEVIINDFGMLKLLSDEFGDKLTLTAGRLLSNQRRDPRTLAFSEIDNNELCEHYLHSSFDYQPFIDLLAKYNVRRVEIDNALQGVRVPDEIHGVSVSMHYPYNYVTVARNCAFCYDDTLGEPAKVMVGQASRQSDSDPWRNKKSCLKKCINATLKLNCDEIDETLYVKGTAIFVKNDIVNTKGCRLIDRLVYSPYVPV